MSATLKGSAANPRFKASPGAELLAKAEAAAAARARKQREPRQGALQRERAARVGEPAHPGRGDRRGHGAQRRWRVAGDRPLRDPEVAGAERGDLPGEPGLPLDPGERGEPVGHFVAIGVELAAGAARAPATLQDDLVAALGEHARPERPDPCPTVGAAHQDDRLGVILAGPYRSARSVIPSGMAISMSRRTVTARVLAGGMRASTSTARVAKLIATKRCGCSVAAGDDVQPGVGRNC